MPLSNKRGDVVLAADARIDNRPELLAALDVPSWSHHDTGDGALILAAYERWGDDCPKRLRGDFAFAIWDERRHRLFCARDQFGVRPFYYHASDRTVVFASEIKALLTLPDVPRRLNELRVADHLAGIFEDQATTFYRHVYRLPAAHTLTVERGGRRVQRYAALDPGREIRLGSDGEYEDAFRERFTEAVRCRLRTTGPIGALLSGGLDSSSITCTARTLLDGAERRVHAFSAVFPGLPDAVLKRIDERPFVDAVVAGGGLIPHRVCADALSPLADVEAVMHHEDEPSLAPNLYMHWGLYREAQRHGVSVLLDGVDGDSTVSHGLDYLRELARRGRVARLLAEAGALATRYGGSPRRIAWDLGLKPLLPEPLVDGWRMLRGRGRRPWTFNSTIHPAFARRLALAERAHLLRSDRRRRPRTARDSHWITLTAGLIPYTLEIADRAAAAFSIEARYPFFDWRLAELCLGLPADQKLRHGWTRSVMRRAMGGVLPDEVRWRTHKADLSPNFRRTLFDRDRAVLDDVIVRDPGVIADYVDVAALRETYARCLSARGSDDDELSVFSAVTLALWLRQAPVRA
jgi:asparagine synthase (glutamine-hydrolysing)